MDYDPIDLEGNVENPDGWRQSGQRPNQTRQPRRRRRSGSSLSLILVCALVAGVCGYMGGRMATGGSQSGVSSAPVVYESVARTVGTDTTSTGAMNTSMVAAQVKPSIVEITTETASWSRRLGQLISTGAGSGVIFTQDGYIVTNHHVVNDASSITVRLIDGEEYPAELIGLDSKTDLAVLKIGASGLIPAVLGDSSTLIVGEGTVVVGNPLGELGGTVTSGILSALDREISIDGETMSLLQTDAAVNPGNSGGGLFNQYGELVGIINAKSSGTDIEGIGFAIPVGTVKQVAADIIEHGYVRGRVDAGITLVEIAGAQTAMRYRVSQLGVYVMDSGRTELQSGDRILTVGGKDIYDMTDYNAALSAYQVGDSVEFTVDRNGRSRTATVQLTEQGAYS